MIPDGITEPAAGKNLKINGGTFISPSSKTLLEKYVTEEGKTKTVIKVKGQSSSSGSSSSQAASSWADSEPAQQTEPKVTPTPAQTQAPVEDPSVKPVTPTDTPAKSPAPFIGVLAGLGAAAVVFGLRRK